MISLLVDTNVLIYVKDRSSEFHTWAQAIFHGEFTLYTTSKNLSEYYAATTRGEKPLLSAEMALSDLSDFTRYCQILYPDPSSQDVLFRLLSEDKPTGLKVHDVEIASIAIANDIFHMATNNPDDFKRIAGLTIIAP